MVDKQKEIDRLNKIYEDQNRKLTAYLKYIEKHPTKSEKIKAKRLVKSWTLGIGMAAGLSQILIVQSQPLPQSK